MDKIKTSETSSQLKRKKRHFEDEKQLNNDNLDLLEITVPKKKIKMSKLTSKATTSKGFTETMNITTDQKWKKENFWEDFELLAEKQCLEPSVAKNLTKMFNEGNTIPFIARYRKDFTNNMSPETLREVKQSYDQIQTLKEKSQSVLRSLETNQHLNDNLKKSILSAKTLEEIDLIYAPFKSTNKKTLFERAKKLGLEESALRILNSNLNIDLHSLIDRKNKDLDKYEKVEDGVIHIIAHIIATDLSVLTCLREMRTTHNFAIEVKKKRSIQKGKEKKENKNQEEKYESYYEFKSSSKFIKSHQIMAINRGESQNALSIKIIIPEFIYKKFCNCCWEQWGSYIHPFPTKKQIFMKAIDDCYKRLIQPLITREIRSELKSKGEKASLEVFCQNLKELLLMKSIKGNPIAGIDPGYTHGCKLAIVGSDGTLLDSLLLFPFTDKENKSAKSLKKLLIKHKCTLIAIGNGTACRETETWLSNLITNQFFQPLNIEYTIINETGASIYSCSEEARKEFPDLDPNIISAVSLARRVQDPLAEYVKIEPKHIGIGMYQHDLSKNQLESALDEVVSECVSFVGVDLNTCSECLLKRVAGLSEKKAKTILDFRKKNGPFVNRSQLMEIKGFGQKTFEQCAGFLKVIPLTENDHKTFYKNPKTNRLDGTIIHPESYNTAIKLITKEGFKLSDIGSDKFIKRMQELKSNFNCEYLKNFDVSEQTLKLILEGLSKTLNYDMRDNSNKVSLFKKGLTSITDLKIETVLTGQVTNNTHFGSFVDIGVEKAGLIHCKNAKGEKIGIGDVVEVKVIDVDIKRARIALELIRIL